MNNSAQSVDVVKDCFGMTKIRKNKVLDPNLSLSSLTNTDDESDGEYHWFVYFCLFIFQSNLIFVNLGTLWHGYYLSMQN